MGEKRFLGKKCFVRGYLDLLIGTLSMRVNKFDKNTGKVTEKMKTQCLKLQKGKSRLTQECNW